jgi:transcription antitermination factor NusG
MALIPCSLDEVDADMPLEVAKWYGVLTNQRCEKRAALSVAEALKPRNRWGDLDVYLPLETYFARHARRLVASARPLLVGYVFVCIRPQDMHTVRLCDGVRDFVRGPGGMPTPVVARELYGLREREEKGEFDATKADNFGGEFKADDAVEVKLGKFTGWPGKVVRMTSAQKVRVVLRMFGKEHEKELDVAELRAA